MATGDEDARTAIQAMKEGAADYVLKPFRLDAVVASLERGLERKRLELEVENYRKRLEQMVDQRTRQLRAALQRIELTYDETLEALAAALDLKDNETAGHSKRVTLFSLEIARGMACSDEQKKQIERGAYLHDIGKIGTPDAILLKPGKLSPSEMEIMREHVRIGYDLVCRVSFLAPAAQIVLTHQERFDGTGYPQGLIGEEIPLGARIFAVADTLDAMTSDRPYRRALPYSAAREEIQRESGRQFDPAVVGVFLAIAEETWENIRNEVFKRSVTPAHAVPAFSGGSSRRSGGTWPAVPLDGLSPALNADHRNSLTLGLPMSKARDISAPLNPLADTTLLGPFRLQVFLLDEQRYALPLQAVRRVERAAAQGDAAQIERAHMLEVVA